MPHPGSATSSPASAPKRLALVASDLGCGGAQRVLSSLAAYWVQAGHEVTVITLGHSAEDFFDLPPEVRRVGLDLLGKSEGAVHGLVNTIRRVWTLRRTLKRTRPDAVVSFADRINVLTLLASRGMRLPVYVSERSDPRHQPAGRPWETLRRRLYPLADGVAVLTTRIAEWMGEFVPPERVRVIPNPVHEPPFRQRTPPPDLPVPFICAVGRLSGEKRFDLLIEAFAACDHCDWSLVIIGEGSARPALEALIRRLSLTERVHLTGLQKNPPAITAHSSLFALSSHHEGFPNAMAETMALGIPAITVDYPAGPGEIVRDGVDGLIVPWNDREALTRSMNRLMADRDLRARMGANARSVCTRFSAPRIMHRWDALVLGEGSRTNASRPKRVASGNGP